MLNKKELKKKNGLMHLNEPEEINLKQQKF